MGAACAAAASEVLVVVLCQRSIACLLLVERMFAEEVIGIPPQALPDCDVWMFPM